MDETPGILNALFKTENVKWCAASGFLVKRKGRINDLYKS